MHSEMRVLALVVVAIFITPSHAGGERTRAEPVKTTQNAGQSQVPSAVVSASKLPEAAPINTLPPKQATTTTALNAAPKSAMTDLPTSNRLAISIFAGVFTLIVALWIGARRD